MKVHPYLLLSLTFLLLASCDRPNCENTNPIFDNYSIESNEYKRELVREIERVNPDNLTYWLYSYSKQDGKEYITVNIQGDGLCTKGILQVINWRNMEGVRKAKGKSYTGAQLKGLTFEVDTNGESIDLIYTNVDRIID